MIDVSHLTVNQLDDLIAQAQQEITRKKALARKSLMADMEKLARDAGVSLNELFPESGTKPVKVKSTVAPKYRNPNDASQTWTGRGRQPLWIAALLAEGKALGDLLI
ncbi:MAG: H-NS histone family protein [Paraperlucidibaca sp.]